VEDFDVGYNEVGRDYEASQGISKRAHCPVYLAVKTEVLAIESALEKSVEKRFYISDLFDVFRAVQERSKFDETVWQSPLSNFEFPTPTPTCLYTITADLDDLSSTAVQKAIGSPRVKKTEAPGEVASALAGPGHSVCGVLQTRSTGSAKFRDSIIEQYLVFILKLGWQPREICMGPVAANAQELNLWRDLFLKELRTRFMAGDSTQQTRLRKPLTPWTTAKACF